MAAPRKLCAELIEVVAQARRDGVSFRAAAALAGCHEESIRLWRRRGEADWQDGNDTLEAQLYVAVEKADGQVEVERVKRVTEGDSGWQGSAWWLERTQRHRYAREYIEPKQQASLDVSNPEELAEYLSERIPAHLLEKAARKAKGE